MIRFRKHIALLLFGIFIIPILFQSVHIIWHHHNNNKSEHHSCSHVEQVKNTHVQGEEISKKEVLCPVCEYQFSINDLPKASFISSVTPGFTFVYNEIIKVKLHKQAYTIKSPRAPPV